MPTKESFVIQLKRTATAASTFVATTQPWASGDKVTITCVAVVNADSNNKDWSWGVKRYESDLYVTTVDGRNAGEWSTWNGEIGIPSDYRTIVRFLDPAAGDKWTANIFGFITRECSEDISDGQ